MLGGIKGLCRLAGRRCRSERKSGLWRSRYSQKQHEGMISQREGGAGKQSIRVREVFLPMEIAQLYIPRVETYNSWPQQLRGAARFLEVAQAYACNIADSRLMHADASMECSRAGSEARMPGCPLRQMRKGWQHRKGIGQ
jgi:hypothetical protein